MVDIRIINGFIPDFGKSELVPSDIEIKDGRIIRVGAGGDEAKITIDAAGQIVSPGFIDIHMHEEELSSGCADPYGTAYFSLLMGVTTNVSGNCGENRQPVADFKGYIDKHGAPTNYMAFIGHNSLRETVGATDVYRPSTRAEIERMKLLIRNSTKEGIVGISYGIEYSPGVTTEEMIELAKTLDSKDYLLSAHYRQDAEYGVEALEEMSEISRQSGIPMQVSHIGSCAAFSFMDAFLEKFQSEIRSGVDLTADCYPYEAFATQIGTAVFDEGCFERWGKTYSDILLTEHPYKNVRCDKELFYKVREEYPDMIVAAFVMREDEVIKAIAAPNVFVGSDSVYNGSSGHPRGAGTFPKVLGRYVREQKKIDLIDALWKMTSGPAQRLRLFTKGAIEEGFDADITIFDRNKISDTADYTNPTLPAKGISHVIINGKIAAKDGKIIDGRCGKFINNTVAI